MTPFFRRVLAVSAALIVVGVASEAKADPKPIIAADVPEHSMGASFGFDPTWTLGVGYWHGWRHVLGEHDARFDLAFEAPVVLIPTGLNWKATAGLTPIAFIEPLRYEPASYLHDPVLIEKTRGLSFIERASVAEALAGNLKTHLVYAAPLANFEGRVARPEGPEAVPLLSAAKGRALAESMGADLSVTATIEGLEFRFVLPPLTGAIVSRIDGRTSLGQIHCGLRALDPDLDWPRFKAQFDRLYKVLNGLNAMLIAHPQPGAAGT